MNVRVDKKFGLHVYGFSHTLGRLCPVETYYDEHPEYFAVVNGLRKQYEKNKEINYAHQILM